MSRQFIVLLASCVILAGCRRELPLSVDKDGGFHLKEISLTEAIERQPQLASCGQRAPLAFKKTWYADDSTIQNKEVKKYPRLLGSKPLYGSVRFDRNINVPGSGIEYFFALDAQEGEEYNRLYFDANRNLDLTDDLPLGLSKKSWPAGLWRQSADRSPSTDYDRLFEELDVPMDFGSGYGVQKVKMLPLLRVNKRYTDDDISAAIMFIPLSFRAGQIKIADKKFDVVLAQQHLVSGRFDRPFTNLFIMQPGKKEFFENWWSSDTLGAFHFVDGKFYSISATPLGDKLFVKAYSGELGTFKLGSSYRDIKDVAVQGSLRSPQSAVAIGKTEANNPQSIEAVAEWQVPVGDYTADLLLIHYGTLDIDLSDNYHSDGKRQDWDRRRKFAIQIRKDKAFVLDFANQPEVMFASPAKDQVFKPGEEISVNAVLIDPVLDIMIRRLDDTREKIKEEIDLGNGKKETREQNKSLDPIVTITDSSGKTVAEGPMPFG
jgi:hypothetical protein